MDARHENAWTNHPQRHRMTRRRVVTCCIVVSCGVCCHLGWLGCRRDQPPSEDVGQSTNGASTDTAAEKARPAAEPPDPLAGLSEQDLPARPRWLVVEKVAEDAPGGWATGRFIGDENKLVIDTENVARFSADLTQMGIDWSRRVVLRIDGTSYELSHDNYPTLRLQRTPGGNWDRVREKAESDVSAGGGPP